MNTDLKYAIKQLRPILSAPYNLLNYSNIVDRVSRALDALERMADAELDTVPEGDECTGVPDPKHSLIYNCSDLNCPIHGERNRKQ